MALTPEIADQHVGGGVVADLNHRNDQLARPVSARRRADRHEVGSADELALTVEDEFVREHAAGRFVHRVGGRHDEHFDDRGRRKTSDGAVRDERLPARQRARADADRPGKRPGGGCDGRLQGRQRDPPLGQKQTAAAPPRKSARFTSRCLGSGGARRAKTYTRRRAHARPTRGVSRPTAGLRCNPPRSCGGEYVAGK